MHAAKRQHSGQNMDGIMHRAFDWPSLFYLNQIIKLHSSWQALIYLPIGIFQKDIKKTLKASINHPCKLSLGIFVTWILCVHRSTAHALECIPVQNIHFPSKPLNCIFFKRNGECWNPIDWSFRIPFEILKVILHISVKHWILQLNFAGYICV